MEEKIENLKVFWSLLIQEKDVALAIETDTAFAILVAFFYFIAFASVVLFFSQIKTEIKEGYIEKEVLKEAIRISLSLFFYSTIIIFIFAFVFA